MTNLRWHAMKMLEKDKEVMSDHPVDLSGILSPKATKKRSSTKNMII